MRKVINRLLLLSMLLLTQLLSAATLTTPNSTTNEDISVSFSGAPATPKDWIGIYPAGGNYGSGNASLKWQYTNGASSGQVIFRAPGLAEGDYVARLFENDSYTLISSSNFSITAANGGNQPSLISDDINGGEDIFISYDNAPGNQTDWVAIYSKGENNGNYISYQHLEGNTSGTLLFSSLNLPRGDYELRMFENDGYTLLASSEFKIIAADVSSTHYNFILGETLKFDYADLPGNALDWIGIYTEGADEFSYMHWAYLDQTNGSHSFNNINLPEGNYEARIYANNGYTLLTKTSFRVRSYRSATHISLPKRGQTHDFGSEAAGNSYYDLTWRGLKGQSGVLSSTVGSGMRFGNYSGLIQLWHQAAPGTNLGTLQAIQDGNIIASATITAETIALPTEGDFQYAKVDFNLAITSDVELQFVSSGLAELTTGVMSLFRTNDKKPIYVFGHRKNNELRVNTSMSRNCNALEIDLATVKVGNQFKLKAHHHATELHWTDHQDFEALIDLCKSYMDSGQMANLYFDIKSPISGFSYDQYAHTLLSMLQAKGFDPNRITIGTFYPANFRNKAIELGFDIVIDHYFYSSRVNGWIEQAEQYSQLQEFGSPYSSADDFLDLTEAIFTRGKIKKTFAWTIANDPGYEDNTQGTISAEYSQAISKRLLILGVDGLMGDNGLPLDAIMDMPVFKDIFRRASAQDNIRSVHGE